MQIILVYDISSGNSQKIFKLCKQYLNWVQNSVFEGELTDSKYKILKNNIKEFSNNEDSFLIYKIKNIKNVEKEIICNEKNNISIFI